MKQILTLTLFFLTLNLSAQEKMVADTTSVKSINGIVKEVLRIISGEQGKTRNWEAFKNLFLPSAHFTVHSHDKTNPQPVETASLQEFIDAMNDTYYDKGFLEYEVNKVVDEYNGIAHVFQTFYAKDSDNFEERGITSYQLVYFNNRWWIVNIVWTGDSNGVKVPEKYLKK